MTNSEDKNVGGSRERTHRDVKVSIITIVKDDLDSLKITLPFSADHIHDDCEILVVDISKNPMEHWLLSELAELVDSHQIRYLRLAGTTSVLSARNIASAGAKGELLCFLDPSRWITHASMAKLAISGEITQRLILVLCGAAMDGEFGSIAIFMCDFLGLRGFDSERSKGESEADLVYRAIRGGLIPHVGSRAMAGKIKEEIVDQNDAYLIRLTDTGFLPLEDACFETDSLPIGVGSRKKFRVIQIVSDDFVSDAKGLLLSREPADIDKHVIVADRVEEAYGNGFDTRYAGQSIYEGDPSEILGWMISEEGYWESFDLALIQIDDDDSNLATTFALVWNLVREGGEIQILFNDPSRSLLGIRSILGSFCGKWTPIHRGGTIALRKLQL